MSDASSVLPASCATPDTEPRLWIDAGLAVITLNRPAHRNRLEDGDLRTLLAHFDRIHQDHAIRACVITANTEAQPKPVFCAGYHIGSFDAPHADTPSFEVVVDALAALRPVTVCALNGSVYGGATDLFLACDLRLALQGTELRMPAAALGLHYYPSGLQRYVAHFGASLAKQLFLTARPISAELLVAHGVASGPFAPDQFALELDLLVKDILALAPLAAAGTKRSINEISLGRHDDATLREREAMTLRSSDFEEGRNAFKQRRPAVFVGR